LSGKSVSAFWAAYAGPIDKKLVRPDPLALDGQNKTDPKMVWPVGAEIGPAA